MKATMGRKNPTVGRTHMDLWQKHGTVIEVGLEA